MFIRCILTFLCFGTFFAVGLSQSPDTSSAVETDSGLDVTTNNGPTILVQDGIIRCVSIDSTVPVSFQVWLRSADIDTVQPMAGKTVECSGGAEFVPRFPLQAGESYTVAVHRDGQELHRADVIIPARRTPATLVEAIYPSADKLPENTLKFYIQFSAAMQKGDVYRFVELREFGGEPVELPFLEIEQEFWSRDSKRLTLLLDPGRIKRGLRPREEMGPILVEGKVYELVVHGEWPDATGKKLGDDIVHRFTAIAPNLVQLDHTKWQLIRPESSQDVIAIKFPIPLDRALLDHAIKIQNADANSVDGKISIESNETRWSFAPKSPWEPGRYRILIDERLEDVSGNSLSRPFDVDMFEHTESPKAKDVVLEFEVDEGSRTERR